mmetsp:Transcript_7462/g.25081  ORF Transcript_7462/g.25081 Transcript_7462/m.25081 type:complete len:238 (+) Transcript_7462:152-865(+)
MRAVFALLMLSRVALPSFSPMGHLGRRLQWISRGSIVSCLRSKSASTALSASPRARRSHPDHATMTPLSVHHLGGGKTSGKFASSAILTSVERTVAFAATPPATTMHDRSGVSSRAHTIARFKRSSRCLTALAWKLAAMSARVCRLSTPSHSTSSPSPPPMSASIAMRAAVFNPAYEKSQFFRCRNGTGNLYLVGSPSSASFSNAGPPPPPTGNPNNLAVLSYASPKASSKVEPNMV